MLIIYLTLFWIVGLVSVAAIASAEFGQPIGIIVWVVAAGSSFLLSLLLRTRDSRASFLLAYLMAFAWGGARMSLVDEQQCASPHICALNDSSRKVELHGLVVAEPDVRDKAVMLRVAVDTVTHRDSAHPEGITETVTGVVLVHATRFPLIEYGSELLIVGKLQTPFESAEFSYKALLAREDIFSTLFLPHIEIIAEGQGNPFLATIFHFKQSAANTISRIIPAPQSGLLKAVLLGDRSDLPQGLQADFRTAGLAHLIAISGFHVAILLLLTVKVAEAFVKPRYAIIITTVVLILYAVLVGLRPSVIRAVLMGIAYLFASRELGQKNATVAVLALVALVMTLWNPLLLWNVGFQLSFAATLGIALFARPLEQLVREKLVAIISVEVVKGWFGRIISIFAVSIAAQILTLPLVGWHFKQLSLISIFANLLVVPVQPLVMLLGGLATLVGLAIEPLGKLIGWVAWLFLSYTIQAVELLARIPYASIPIDITPASLVFFYLLIGLGGWYGLQSADIRSTWHDRIRSNLPQRAALTTSGLVAIFMVAWSNAQPDGKLHIFFFDVGQGDATLIVTPTGRQILIDGGYYPSIINAELGRTIPFWDRELDLVIATHPDADHVTGLPDIFDRYHVGQFIYDGNLEDTTTLYDATLERVERDGITRKVAVAGETIVIGDGVRLEIIHPGSSLDDETRNNNSVSLRLVYGDFSAILTGDAEQAAESHMLASGLPLNALVYKVGHHGSRTSSTQSFLDAIHPQIAIISAGADNKFGHPHAEVTERLNAQGIAILDTRTLGTIELTSDGTHMWWQAYR